MINKFMNIYEQLKADKPRIHMIPNGISATFCADIISAAGAKPIMAIDPKETAAITEHAGCLVINMGQLTEKKFMAIMESVKAAESKDIPVVLDPVGAGASSYRLGCINEILNRPWKGLIKLNHSEYVAITKQMLTHSGVDSEMKIREITPFQSFGKDRGCCLTGEEDWIGEGEWEIRVKHIPNRLPQIVGSGCGLGALCGAIRAVEEDNIIAGSMAAYLMSIAALKAEEKAIGYMDYKMYLIDSLYTMKIDDLRRYADLLIERGKQKWI